MSTDQSGVALVAQRLGAEFPDRSPVQILTAVLDAWDHVVGPTADPASATRSARARLG